MYTNVAVLIFGAIVGVGNKQLDDEIAYGWRVASLMKIAWAIMLVSGASKGSRGCQIGMYDLRFFDAYCSMYYFGLN